MHEIMDMSKKMKHGYASRTCGIDMDMQYGNLYSMEMQRI
jgi:hypothetical protein